MIVLKNEREIKLMLEACRISAEALKNAASNDGGATVGFMGMNMAGNMAGNIFGQEKNVTNAAIAKMNLLLHGASDFNIMQGDTLRDPKILQGGSIARFDCVIANPPFSLKKWGETEWRSDKFSRNIWGTPTDDTGADYAWIQHMIHHLAPKGKIGLVLANGALSATGVEKEIRRNRKEV